MRNRRLQKKCRQPATQNMLYYYVNLHMHATEVLRTVEAMWIKTLKQILIKMMLVRRRRKPTSLTSQ